MNVGIGQEWQRGVVGTVARIIGMDSGVWRQSLQALDGELEGEREEQLPGSLLEQLRGQRCHLLSIVGQERLFRAVCNQPRTIESQHDLKSWTTSVVIYFASVVPKLFLVTCKHLKNIDPWTHPTSDDIPRAELGIRSFEQLPGDCRAASPAPGCGYCL